MTNRRLYAALLAAVLLAGCSGLKTYPDTLPKNLHLRTTVSKVSAALHVHGVDASCRSEYQGTVQLDARLVDVGIPAGRPSLLVFTFSRSSFLSGSSSSLRYDTLLTPRAGYTYDIRVTYADDLYNVAVREMGPRGSSAREIEHRNLSACRS